MSESVRTFKFKASILFAIISFLIVIIAGLLKDVRFVTIAWRSLLAFFVAGAIAYFVIFILEFKRVINFDAVDAEEKITEVRGKSEEKSKLKSKSKEQKGGEKKEEEKEESGEESSEGEESGGFKPLNADNLQKIVS